MSPFDSENLTELVEQDDKEFVAIRSPDTAEHNPDYREVGRFPTREFTVPIYRRPDDLVAPGRSIDKGFPNRGDVKRRLPDGSLTMVW